MTTTTTTPTILDPSAVDEFAGRLFAAGLGAVELVNIALGARLGFYRALADAGPTSPDELAALTGTASRYTREWLEQQAVAEVVDVEDLAADDDQRRYRLPAERAHVLLDEDGEAHMLPLVQSALLAASWLPMLEPAYRTGGGVPYRAYGVHDLQAAFTRAVAKHHVVQRWLPLLPDVHERLVAGGARVAEVGCGEGLAAIAIAEAFPGVTVDGFDLDDASIAAARRLAADSAAGGRLRFEVEDAGTLDGGGYELVLCIEMLHDTSNPIGLLRAMRRLRSTNGAVLVVDERVASHFAVPSDPIERLLYAFSTLHCLPVGLAEEPSAATGAVLRPGTLRRYAEAAGFSSVTELPGDHPQFRLYRLEG